MTAIDHLTGASSLKNSDVIQLSPKIRKMFSEALDITLKNEKEIGIYACGRDMGDKILLTNGILATSNTFDRHKFSFDLENHPSLERSLCHGDEELKALAHTHPNGNSHPSRQDRFISESIDLLGCLIGMDDTKCFYGDKDFEVVW